MSLKSSGKLQKVLAEIGDKMSNRKVKVGFLEGATYPDGTPVAAAAFWTEFGRSNQPPRPFFRNMISEESGSWGAKIAKLSKATNYDGATVLNMMGEDISGALKSSIISTNEPALSPITLMLRKMVGNRRELITGSMLGEAAKRVNAGETGATGTQAKPLVWTGHMLNSVGYEVEDGS